MNTKVSVIVPVYNVAPYIRQCLDTLVNQTLKDIEIILINDGSQDNSGIICNEYSEKDKRIVFIDNDQKAGVSACRNLGIRMARGAYIGFVDPDDWVDLAFFENLYGAANQDKADIAKAGRIIILEQNKARYKEKRSNKKIRNRIKRNVPVFLTFTYQHTTAIYRKELLVKNDIHYPDIQTAEDNVFLLRVCYFARSVALVANTYYYYRKRPGSASAFTTKAHFDSIIKFLDLSLVFINTHEMEKSHYDTVFIRSFNLALKRYKQLAGVDHLVEYRKEYLKNILALLNLYKYNHLDIIESLIFGFRFHVFFKHKRPRLYALATRLLHRFGLISI